MTLNQARLHRLNDQPIVKDGQFVLYWMQAQRRLSHNHSLDYAIKCANELGKAETPRSQDARRMGAMSLAATRRLV